MSHADWIPVGTALPDDDTLVIIAMNDDDVWTGYRDGDIWRYVDAMPITGERVTHWMALPSSPSASADAGSLALIEPVMPARDAHGWWTHPGVPDYADDAAHYRAWLADQGLEVRYKALEDDDRLLWAAWFESADIDISAWTPEPPKGSGWFTLSIHDTDEGPVWVWARRVPSQWHSGATPC